GAGRAHPGRRCRATAGDRRCCMTESINQIESFAEVARGAKALKLDVRHGDVAVRAVEGAEWSLTWADEEGFGEATARDVFAGVVRVSSGHGDLRLDRWRGQAELKTGNGDVEVNGTEGQIDIKSGNGDLAIRVDGKLAVSATTGHGDVHVEGQAVSSLFVRT